MLKNYIKTGFRHLRRSKTYSFINIIGFAFSLASAIMVLLYVQNQLSFDRFNKHAGRIYRVIKYMDFNGRKTITPITGAPVARTLAREIPGVKQATRLFPARTYWDCSVGYKGRFFPEERFFFADSNFFSVFSIRLLEGNPSTALRNPNSVLLTRSSAEKYFGDENPVGRTLQVFLGQNRYTLEVTGVTQDVPADSHFHFDFLASLSTLPFSRSTSWWPNPFYTYVLIKKGVSSSKIEGELPPVVQEHVGLSQRHYGLMLQPLTSIHLNSHYQFEIGTNGRMTDVYIFEVAGLLLILVSLINYANLETARAASRAREIGVRKACGANRTQLFLQLMSEAVISVVCAVVISVALAEILLPLFNSLVRASMKIVMIGRGSILPDLLIMAAGLSLLSGFYPALVITSFGVSSNLRGRMANGHEGRWLGGGLVTLQFVISIVLIIAALVVRRQMLYVFQMQLGFDKQHVLVIQDAQALGGHWKPFVHEIESDPDVLQAAGAEFIPGRHFDTVGLSLPQESGGGKHSVFRVDYDFVSRDFLSTLGIELRSGRDFSSNLAADTRDVLLNEAVVRELGLREPVGKDLNIGFKTSPVTIIGVTRNFNFQSLRRKIDPMVILLIDKPPKYIVARLGPGDVRQAISGIGMAWRKFSVGQPFVYSFLNRDFDQLYGSDVKLGEILGAFSMLAIVMAFLGLFGLAANTVERRTKEIGVRKVLGASVPGVVGLLSREFISLVLLANVMAWPLAYYLMQRWLQAFAYRRGMSIWIFILAGGIALLVVSATVGVRAVRAARANPVESLRYE